MSSRLSPFIFILAVAVLVVSACSSTTVVADENRQSSPTATDDDAGAESSPTAADDATNTNTSDDTTSDEDDPDLSDDDPETPRQQEEAAGFGLGGSEQLAALRGDCEAGGLTACDVLFQLSDFGTDEEAIALSCADRGDAADGFCTEGIVAAAGELYFDDDSEGLAAVIDRCVDDGDLIACDFLFFRSGPSSEAEEIGSTCGGRVDVAVPDCRTFLADDE